MKKSLCLCESFGSCASPNIKVCPDCSRLSSGSCSDFWVFVNVDGLATCTQVRRPTGDLGFISTERRPYILRQGAQDKLQIEHVKPPNEQPAARHCQQQSRQMPRARRERVGDNKDKEIGI